MDRIDRLDLIEERAMETYRELYELEVERLRIEWREQFGDDSRFPFAFNGTEIHKQVLQQMAA